MKSIRLTLALLAAAVFSGALVAMAYRQYTSTGAAYLVEQAAPDWPNSELPILFTLTGCEACDDARQFLAENGFAVTERELSTSEENRRMFSELEIGAVPVLVSSDSTVVGFSEPLFRDALEAEVF